MITLPGFADAFHTYNVALDGRDYVFEFRFNQREERWYLSIAQPNGTPLATGVKIVCRTDLLRRFADTRLPEGLLMATAQNVGNEDPPGLTELGPGKRVELTYLTKAELAAELKAGRARRR